MTVEGRLSELAATHGLPADVVERLRVLLDVLATDPTAATTVTKPVAAVDTHIADSLTGLEVDAIRQAARIADLGAGAGLPGLVLAAALPATTVALVESIQKKCDFLERTAEAMGLTNVEVVARRAENWPEGLGRQDVVTARALAPLTALVEYAAPLLTEGGTLVAWKGRRDAEEEADGAAAAAATGMEQGPIVAVQPFAAATDRHLHLYLKVRETPARFPRRPGMARKRPIRASSNG